MKPTFAQLKFIFDDDHTPAKINEIIFSTFALEQKQTKHSSFKHNAILSVGTGMFRPLAAH